MKPSRGVGIRWTIGDVGPRGFEALRLSILGAWRMFGAGTAYAVCVNSIPLERARARTGEVPDAVAWRPSTNDLPAFLRAFLDRGMAEGAAWKFAPLRVFPDRYEIALDNDCILWEVPCAMRAWLGAEPALCLLAEDVRACFGAFAELCPPEPRNCGIRGFPPAFDIGAALEEVLRRRPVPLGSELDEQGLQVAAMSQPGTVLAVSLKDVTICSPFYPHLPELGRCGAHFVSLNARHIPFDYYERPGDEWMTEHWARHRPALYRAVGLRSHD